MGSVGDEEDEGDECDEGGRVAAGAQQTAEAAAAKAVEIASEMRMTVRMEWPANFHQ